MASEEDAKVDAFARAERRRKSIVFLILGVIVMIGGAIVTAVLLAFPDELAKDEGAGAELLVLAAGAVVVGLVIVIAAYRIARGKMADLGLDTDLTP